MRVFLDLNVLLDVLLARPKLDLESEAVLLRCDTLGAEIFIAWHSLATAYYLLRRGRTEAEALLEIDRILDWASIATTDDQSARRARHLGFRDFEDALQAVAAETCGANVIVTRNITDFALAKVKSQSPANFLRSHSAPNN
ncbi:MAG: PIN domain-containing protein [Pirellulaceae bacterium]|jgi:predicted nucleic acid-binding protein|nr:PIN domain-containing protein [Pirellulaceae bacterium]